MGEVWGGTYPVQEVPVAVKVVTRELAFDERVLAALRNEVRIAAGFDHPFVVRLYEQGEVDARAEAASGGKLAAGSPYVAMELVGGGSLRQQARPEAPPLTWPALRGLLLDLLDALAHVHARGYVHRDLKPENVLLAGEGDLRPGPKLTDFGLASALDTTHRGEAASLGTPGYMAPEQLLGRHRDIGPWTDLYALGCVAFELASGTRPFAGAGDTAVRNAQVAGRRRAFVGRGPLPAGFEEWLDGLLARRPERRFRRAADVAWVLCQLGPAVVRDSVDEEPRTRTVPGGGPVPARLTPSARPGPDPVLSGDELTSPPPLPSSWRGTAELDRPTRLAGAGLGLFGLRTVPLVGRQAEREALWRELHAVHSGGVTRVVALLGPAGCGKTRLATWLARRAHELGAATVLEAVHGEVPGPACGLGPMLRRFLRCAGLAPHRARDRVRARSRGAGLLDDDDVAAVASLAEPSSLALTDGRSTGVRFAGAADRHAVIVRFLAALARSRPPVLTLDDVQWGADALSLCDHLLEADPPFPALILLTARDEALALRPGESRLLSGLLERPRARGLRVEPLPPEDRPQLVRALLGLDGELAAAVETRTAGNPLFAIQLVGDWASRGLLAPGPDGFALRQGAAVELPDDLHQVWSEQVDEVLRGLPEEDGQALELAATLGQDVARDELREACVLRGELPSARLEERLLSRCLVRRAPEGAHPGLAFVHGMLRESLERRAREAGRAAGHHEACARMLARRSGPDVPERRGHHLLAAGDPAAALLPLEEGAWRRLELGDLGRAAGLLSAHVRALDLAGLPESDEHAGAGLALRARLARYEGRLEEARQLAERAVALGRRHRWQWALPEGLYEAAAADWHGRSDEALALLEEAERRCPTPDDRRLRVQILLTRADALAALGRLAEARASATTAVETAATLHDEAWEAQALVGLAVIHVHAGRPERARDCSLRALPVLREAGLRTKLVVCYNVLGEAARKSGLLAAAEQHYREAQRLGRAVGWSGTDLVELNLGLVMALAGQHEPARALFEGLLDVFLARGHRSWLGAVHGVLLLPLAHLGDWTAWDRHLAAATELLGAAGVYESDLAETLQRAAEAARAAGEEERAEAAFGFALAQWEGLGRAEEAAALRRARRTRRS